MNAHELKLRDADIIRMNSVGLSQSTIASALGCHPTTVTQRLKFNNVEPADTRRGFMEDIIMGLGADCSEWLADQVSPNLTIKDFMVSLIKEKYDASN
jgi:hypothetical protein